MTIASEDFIERLMGQSVSMLVC